MNARSYYYSSLTATQPAFNGVTSATYALDTPSKSNQDSSLSSSQALFSSSQANPSSSVNLFASSGNSVAGNCMFPAFQALKQSSGVVNSQQLVDISSRMEDMNSKIVDAILSFRGDLKDLPEKMLTLLRSFLDFHHRDLAEAAAKKTAESFDKDVLLQIRAKTAEEQSELVEHYLAHVDKSLNEFSLTISRLLEEKLAEFRGSLLQDCVDDVFSKVNAKLDSVVVQIGDNQREAFDQLKSGYIASMSKVINLIEVSTANKRVNMKDAQTQAEPESEKIATVIPATKGRRGRKKKTEQVVVLPELELEPENVVAAKTKKRSVGGGKNKRKSTGMLNCEIIESETKKQPFSNTRSRSLAVKMEPSSYSTEYTDCNFIEIDNNTNDDLSYLLD